MRIEIHFYVNRGVNMVGMSAGRPTASAPVATPGPGPMSTDLDSAGKTIAATMRAHGIPDAQWVLPVLGPLSPQGSSPAIIGSIAKPTRDKIEAILRDALAAMPDSLAWMAANVQVQTWLSIDDCGAAEAHAQQAAIADARARATSVAQAASVRLGPAIAVTELGTPAPGACRTKPDDASTFNSGYSVSPYDPTLDVPISVTATVTFAIK